MNPLGLKPTDAKAVLAELQKMGKAKTRAICRRHGYLGPLVGVNSADLHALKKRVKKDQALAEALWRSGNADARVLATMVADPAELTPALGDRWARESGFTTLAPHVGMLAGESPLALDFARRWRKDAEPMARYAGGVVLAGMQRAGKPVPEALLRQRLKDIEERIHTEENWVRYGMVYGLIGIGGYNPRLREEAIQAAKRIGKVAFDPGDTDCKLPDPIPYIERMEAHQAKLKKGSGPRRLR